MQKRFTISLADSTSLSGMELPVFELQQAAQMARPRGFAVDQIAEILVRIPVAGARRLLNATDCVGIPRVLFAVTSPVEKTGIGEFLRDTVRVIGIANVMAY